MKCIVIESNPDQTNARPVADESGAPVIYASMTEARAELKANGYSYNRANRRYYIADAPEYRAYIVREDSEEYAEIMEQTEQEAAPETIEPELVNAYAAAIGEPTPAHLADAARRVFNGEDPAPMHYDKVKYMREVIEDHEKDPGALRELFDSLKAGAVYGHQVNNVPCPFFWENIGIHAGWIKWNHYGASANRVTMHDLAFVVFVIFKTTPRRFMAEYERR